MTLDASSYQRQVTSWCAELQRLGERLNHVRWADETAYVCVQVRDLRVRIRKVCDELGLYTDDTETIDSLIRKILDKINE